jgi:two-component system, OmpR family, heavy metal sensor histidine kinase CusS
MPSKTVVERQRSPWSLATLLTAWFAAAAFALLALATWFLYHGLDGGIEREDLAQLEDRADFFASHLKERPDDLADLGFEAEWLTRQSAPMFVEITDGAGAVLVRSPGMEIGGGSVTAFGVSHAEHDGRPYYVLRRALDRPVGGHLVLALDRTDDREFVVTFRNRAVAVLVAGLLAATLTGYALARLSLRPVAQIAEAVRGVQLTQLSIRIQPERFPTELAELASTFNAMLARLEEAAGRLSEFSADMAHEVRTPLTVLQGQLELALRSERSPAEYRDVLAASLEECETLTRLVDRLLFLARTEDPAAQVERAAVPLLPFLRDMVEFFEPLANERGTAISVAGPEAATAFADRQLLQRAIGNLLENALRHTPEGGRVGVEVVPSRHEMAIVISDSGPGIPTEVLPHLFDRFFRADRSAGARGVGLGLAIVKRVATLLGGSVEAASEPGKGSRFTVRLSSAPPT